MDAEFVAAAAALEPPSLPVSQPLKILATVRREGRQMRLESVHSTIPVTLVLITTGGPEPEAGQPPTTVVQGRAITELEFKALLLSSLLPQVYLPPAIAGDVVS